MRARLEQTGGREGRSKEGENKNRGVWSRWAFRWSTECAKGCDCIAGRPTTEDRVVEVVRMVKGGRANEKRGRCRGMRDGGIKKPSW